MKKLAILATLLLIGGCVNSPKDRGTNTKRILKAHPQCETEYPVYQRELRRYSKHDLKEMVLSRIENRKVSDNSALQAVYPDYKSQIGKALESHDPVVISDSELACVLSDSVKLALKYQNIEDKEIKRKAKEKEESEKKRQESIDNRKKWEASKEGKSTKLACLMVGKQIALSRHYNNANVVMFAYDGHSDFIQCSVEATGEDAYGLPRVNYFNFIYNTKNSMYEITF